MHIRQFNNLITLNVVLVPWYFFSEIILQNTSIIKSTFLNFLTLIISTEINFLFFILYFSIISSNTKTIKYFTPLLILILVMNVNVELQIFNDLKYLTLNLKLLNGLFFIHPHLLYASYSLIAILFVISIKVVSLYILTSFSRYSYYLSFNINNKFSSIFYTFGLLLFLAIVLGSWWAQQELDWGGWWNWDYVELISFILLIVFISNIHSLKRLENYKKFTWFYLFILFSFILSTRYNIFPSIHNFLGIIHIKVWGFFLIVILWFLVFFVFLKHFFIKHREKSFSNLNVFTLYANGLLLFYLFTFYSSIYFSFFLQGTQFTLQSNFKNAIVISCTSLLLLTSTLDGKLLIFTLLHPFIYLIIILKQLVLGNKFNGKLFHASILYLYIFFFSCNFRDDFYFSSKKLQTKLLDLMSIKFDNLATITLDYISTNSSVVKNSFQTFFQYLNEPETIDDIFYYSHNTINFFTNDINIYILTHLSFILILLSYLFILLFLEKIEIIRYNTKTSIKL